MDFDFVTFRAGLALQRVRCRLRPEVEAALEASSHSRHDLDNSNDLHSRAEHIVRDICRREEIAVPEALFHSLATNIVFDILHPELRSDWFFERDNDNDANA